MEMIETIARERRVETMIENIAKQPLAAELKDLAQMVYLVLLEYDETKLADLWENDQINFFIARIILNQYRSDHSAFHNTFRKFQDRSVNISVVWDISEADIEHIRHHYVPRRDK